MAKPRGNDISFLDAPAPAPQADEGRADRPASVDAWLQSVDLTEQTLVLSFSQGVDGHPNGRNRVRMLFGKGGDWPGACVRFDPDARAYLVIVDGAVKILLHDVRTIEVR